MKRLFIKDITNDSEVNDYFVVAKKGVYNSRNNKKYMALRLKDSTGSIEARAWDAVDELSVGFEKNDIVYVQSRARAYQDAVQLNVTAIRKVEEDLSIDDMRDFYPQSEAVDDGLTGRFDALVQGFSNPSIVALFERLGARKDIMERYFSYPASVGVHHVSISGLLLHSVTVAEMGRRVAPLSGGDMDLVVAGALLHDVGKVEEITVKGGFRHSDRGRLLGHITLGVMLLDELLDGMENFPPHVADVLRHIIVSHHGETEWGSPKRPMCIEALVVHYLDNLDAKTVGVKEHMKESMEDENWTQYHRLYESRFYKIPER